MSEQFHQAVLHATATFAAHQHELRDLRPEFWIALGTLTGASKPPAERNRVIDAFKYAYPRLGAPGDFGYGTPCGDALKALYDAYNAFLKDATINETAGDVV